MIGRVKPRHERLSKRRPSWRRSPRDSGSSIPNRIKAGACVVNSFYDWLVPETTRQSLLVLLGAVALVLLIACVNVVNLMLARAAGRQRPLSIRAAMGASRGRVVRQVLLESSLIAVIAAMGGLVITFAATRLLIALAPDSVPRLDELSIDPTRLRLRARGRAGPP